TPDARLVGLSFLVYNPGGEPVGFAGPNDHWHPHNANGVLCFGANNVVMGAEDVSVADCEARGGHKATLEDIWMVHDWVVPGWECSWGVFAPECPELGGTLRASAGDCPAELEAIDVGSRGLLPRERTAPRERAAPRTR